MWTWGPPEAGARMASGREGRSGKGALGGSGQAACSRRASSLGLDGSLLARGLEASDLDDRARDAGTWAFRYRRQNILSSFGRLPGPEAGPGSRLPGRTPCHRPSLGLSALATRLGMLAGAPGSATFRRRGHVGSGFLWECEATRLAEAQRPAAPAGRARPEGRLPPAPPAPCWQSQGRTAGAWGRSPCAAGSPQLLAAPKMTICHSIKVSGQLMGEPGSPTPGQNGLLPRIGEVQMLNAEHCALSQPRPPPGRRPARWTAAG